MICPKRMAVVLTVALLGIWGCAQGPSNGTSGANERIRALESKNGKLEEDFKSAVAARDQLRKRVTTAEDQRNQLRQEVEQLQNTVKERDELAAQLKLRIKEREQVQGQFDQFRKTIKDLIGQTEAAMTPPSGNSTPATVALEPTGDKS